MVSQLRLGRRVGQLSPARMNEVCAALRFSLGLSFQMSGETYDGWVELSIKSGGAPKGSFAATVTGYAYETIPGMAINAGQTTDADDASAIRPGAVNRHDSSIVAFTNPTQELGPVASVAFRTPHFALSRP